ncbi:hypothetical protein [Tsukamurella paurometabola]|uniref:Uncharacterized protein n=1 Tax=Tsukamurella paurometabola TaxID=2061 RepID=A0A3P8L3S6_TSUPA|nr:hypothetical protein [Tsukamurella paurometabola]UEA84446.1 hypothetical protein LK411_06380 [Tsukamurella paurometabola]VDR37011.1 Uncharacterised protein [Tsukamurella paurometabola]
MTPADQQVDLVVAAQARVRALTAQDLVDRARSRMESVPGPLGGPWDRCELNAGAATALAQELLDERAERLRIAGRVHNLAGDLEKFLTQWTADDLSDFGLVQQVETVIELLQKQVAALKAVVR